jgi:PIN domain nuclease of toxin-antitoxin system
MDILLDTHIIFWTLSDDAHLSAEARKIILNPQNRIFYSVGSLWEVAIKHRLKPDKIPLSAEEFLHYCELSGFQRLSIKDRHIIELEKLPPIHTDPFDCLLVAQAQSEQMVLLTHDSILLGYGANTVRIV